MNLNSTCYTGFALIESIITMVGCGFGSACMVMFSLMIILAVIVGLVMMVLDTSVGSLHLRFPLRPRDVLQIHE